MLDGLRNEDKHSEEKISINKKVSMILDNMINDYGWRQGMKENKIVEVPI